MVATPVKPPRTYGFELQRFLEEVYSRLGVEDIYTDSSHQFKISGDRHRGGCPFHQSKSRSSFVVTGKNLLFWCEGCRQGGSAIDYIHSRKVGHWAKPRGIDFIEAVKELASIAGMSLPEVERTPESVEKARFWEARRAILQAVAEYSQEVLWSSRGLEARRYLIESRGLTEDGIRDLGLGLYLSKSEVQQVLTSKGFNLQDAKAAGVIWSKLEGYILFPWLDSRNRPLTIYGRYQTMTPPADKPKTIALKGSGTKASPLYLDRALKAGHKHIILVEGVLDAALLQSQGDTRVCAYVAASCSNQQIETLRRHRIESVTLCGDPDSGGENGTHSNIDRLCATGIKVYVAPGLPDGLDPDEFLIREGMSGWNRHIDSAAHAYTFKARSILASNDLSTDKGKAAIIKAARVFCESVLATDKEKQMELQTFFWSEICQALGVSADEFYPTTDNSGGSGGDGGSDGGDDGGSDGGSDGGDGDSNNWNAPVSWNGEIGWLITELQPVFITHPDTGEKLPVLDDQGKPVMEPVRKFIPKCNFDFQIERELEDSNGGGLVLQVKRSIDSPNQQKRVIISSLDYGKTADFESALKKVLGTGIVVNLKSDQLKNLIHVRLREYRERGGLLYRRIERYGQQDDGTWVFSDRQYTIDGTPTNEEKTHLVFNPDVGKKDFIPAPELAQTDPHALRTLIDAQAKVAGSNFMRFLLCDGYVAAALNYQAVTKIEGFFPILNPYGDPGGYKTVAVKSALSLVWDLEEKCAIASTTVSMAYERLSCLGSIPSLWDDPRSKTRQDKEDLDEFFKRLYNGLPRTVRGHTQVPRSVLIPTTNHSLGETVPATKTRTILLFFPITKDANPDALDELSAAKEKASGAFEQLIKIGYDRACVKAVESRLRKHLPTSHDRAAANLAILVFYTQKVVELAQLDIDVEQWVIKNLCPELNEAQTGLNSVTDFFEKFESLKSDNSVGLWNASFVETSTHGSCLALHMPSIWPVFDKQFSPTYNLPVLERCLVELGAIKNKSAKLYPNRDITLAYIKELHKGANQGSNWVPPKKPKLVPKKCLLIPQKLWEQLGIEYSPPDKPDPDDPNNPNGNGPNKPVPKKPNGQGGGDGTWSPWPKRQDGTMVVPNREQLPEVTTGNLDSVTTSNPDSSTSLAPAKEPGNQVNSFEDKEEKKEKIETGVSTGKNQPTPEGVFQNDPSNQGISVTNPKKSPETIESTGLEQVTAPQTPEVTQESFEVTSPSLPKELSPELLEIAGLTAVVDTVADLSEVEELAINSGLPTDWKQQIWPHLEPSIQSKLKNLKQQKTAQLNKVSPQPGKTAAAQEPTSVADDLKAIALSAHAKEHSPIPENKSEVNQAISTIEATPYPSVGDLIYKMPDKKRSPRGEKLVVNSFNAQGEAQATTCSLSTNDLSSALRYNISRQAWEKKWFVPYSGQDSEVKRS